MQGGLGVSASIPGGRGAEGWAVGVGVHSYGGGGQGPFWGLRVSTRSFEGSQGQSWDPRRSIKRCGEILKRQFGDR